MRCAYCAVPLSKEMTRSCVFLLAHFTSENTEEAGAPNPSGKKQKSCSFLKKFPQRPAVMCACVRGREWVLESESL